MHRPSAFVGAALQPVLIVVGTAFGLVACFLLAPLGPVVAGWVAAPDFGGVFEGAGAATIGTIASFAGFLVLLWIGVTGPLAARADVLFITGSIGAGYVVVSLPFVALAGGVLGRVGYVLGGFAPFVRRHAT